MKKRAAQQFTAASVDAEPLSAAVICMTMAGGSKNENARSEAVDAGLIYVAMCM